MRIGQDVIDAPPRESARVIARGLLAACDREAARLAAKRDPEALHDFRVALRRLRTALRSLDASLEIPRRIQRRLKRCARGTNAARDAEVHLAWIDRVAAGLRRREAAGAALLRARIEAATRGAEPMERTVKRYRRASARLSRRLARTGDPDHRRGARPRFGDALAALLQEQLQMVRDRLDDIRGPLDEEAIHAARIEAKRLRYLLEPVRDVSGAARVAVERLKALQDQLGELHDTHVLAREVRCTMIEAARDEAGALHRALFGEGAGGRAVRDAMRMRPRPGLVAITRLLRDRRDALFAAIDRTRREGGIDVLAEEVRGVATALATPVVDRRGPRRRLARGLRTRGGVPTRARRRTAD